MKTYLNLTFKTTEGRLFTIRIPNSFSTPDLSNVRDSMDAIIDSGSIQTQYGELLERSKAQVYRISTTGFDVTGAGA